MFQLKPERRQTMDKIKNDGEGAAGDLDYLYFLEDEAIDADSFLEGMDTQQEDSE